MNSNPELLRNLTDKLLDAGELSPEESERLEALLQEEGARAEFLADMHRETLVKKYLSGKNTAAALSTEKKIIRFSRVSFFAAGMAVSVIVFCLLGFLQKYLLPEGKSVRAVAALNESSPRARITGLVGAVWKTDVPEPSFTTGGTPPERLALQAGLAEITYGTGARVTIQGPCDFSITGINAGRLEFGKLVTYVPQRATGFVLNYSGGKIIDIGTEFAVDVAHDGSAEIGVFEGEIKLQRNSGEKQLSLYGNQALAMPTGSSDVQSVPLNREKFIRRIPARDFRWEIKPGATQKFQADVSHLIWKPATYIAIFKIFWGNGVVTVRNVRLLLDGKEVAADMHAGGLVCLQSASKENIYELRIVQGELPPGRWTLEAELACADDDGGAPHTGIMQLEEGLMIDATAKDFIGTWSYPYAGHHYERRFLADGTAELLCDGVIDQGGFRNGRWEIKDGELLVHSDSLGIAERHRLRDADTLIFVNVPYENAKRKIEEERK